MLTKKQIEVLRAFKKDLFRSFSFTGLKKELKETSSSKLQKTIKDFESEELINVSYAGKTKLISLNFNSNKLFDYFSIFERESHKKIPYEVLNNLQNEILKKNEFFSLIVFGSYALGKQKKSSDLDVALIVDNEDIKKKILPVVNSVKKKSLLEIHVLIFTREEFLEMLRAEEENVGKEIARNNFVFYGLANFYKLILKEEKWRS